MQARGSVRTGFHPFTADTADSTPPERGDSLRIQQTRTDMELCTGAALVLTATAVAYVGATRASTTHFKALENGQIAGGGDLQHQDVGLLHAACFPVVASISLVFLFLFASYLDLLFVGYIAIMAIGSVTFLVEPVCTVLFGSARMSSALAAATGGMVTAGWAWTGHWFLNNVIGAAICVTMMAVLRIPSLKVATVALVGLLIYDAYFVFYSKNHFGENVMVAVAQHQAENPVVGLAASIPGVKDLPQSYLPIPALEMPNKFMFPAWIWAMGQDGVMTYFLSFMMLGLGDVALPGMLLSYAKVLDLYQLQADADILTHATTSEVGAASTCNTSVHVAATTPNCAARNGGVVTVSDGDIEVGGNTEGGGDLVPAATHVIPLTSRVVTLEVGQLTVRNRVSARLAAVIRQLRYDVSTPSYFRTCWFGFAVGILVSILMSRTFHAAQPALVYLVPAVLLPMLARGLARNEVSMLWRGKLRRSASVD